MWATTFRQPYRHSTSDASVVRLCTSWLLPPSVVATYRLVISLYAFVVLLFILGWESARGDSQSARQSFSYFTVLTYWGIAFYFAVAAAHSASYARRGRAWLQDWPAPLRCLHGVFYGAIVVLPIIVTVVFWGVLSENAFATQFSTWSNISEHALNSVFAVLEIILIRSDPLPPVNVLPLIVILGCYLGLAYLSHDTWGFYVYGFLDPKIGRGKVAGACVGILVATVVVFFVVSGIIWLRRYLTETKLGMHGKFSARSGNTHDGLAHISMVQVDEPKVGSYNSPTIR